MYIYIYISKHDFITHLTLCKTKLYVWLNTLWETIDDKSVEKSVTFLLSMFVNMVSVSSEICQEMCLLWEMVSKSQ